MIAPLAARYFLNTQEHIDLATACPTKELRALWAKPGLYKCDINQLPYYASCTQCSKGLAFFSLHQMSRLHV